MLKITDLGVEDEMFQNDPKNQHGSLRYRSWTIRKSQTPPVKAEMLPAKRLGTDRVFTAKPVVRPALGEPDLSVHLNCLSQRSHNCPLFLGSKSQGHISKDHI